MTVAAHLALSISSMGTLDFGMGWGLWARIAADMGCGSFGDEINPDRRAYAMKHGVRAIDEDEIDGRMFYFINTEQVMEHVTHPLDITRLLARALKPGGVLKILAPNGEQARQCIADLKDAESTGSEWTNFMPVHPLEQINAFTRHSIGDG